MIKDKIDGRCALHFLAEKSSLEFFTKICTAPGIDLLVRNWNNDTPIHFALFRKNYDVALLMLNYLTEKQLKTWDPRGFDFLTRNYSPRY
jgi:ankyrin repeat protein